MKDKQLNKEEQLFSDKLNELEFEYNSADWDALQDRLPKGGNSSWLGTKGIIGIAAVAVVLVGSVYYLNQEENKAEQPIEKTQFVEQAEEKPTEAIEKNNQPIASEENAEQAELKPTEKDEIIPSQKTEEAEEVDKNEQKIVAEVKNTHKEKASAKAETTEKAKPTKVAPAKNKENLTVDLPNKVCSDQIHLLMLEKADELPTGFIIHWNFDGIKEVDSNSPGLKEAAKSASYLTAKIKNEKGEVVKNLEKRVEIVDVDQLTADFTYVDSEDPYTDLQVEFKAKEEGFVSFEWNGEDDRSIGKGKELNYAFKDQGVYYIELNAKTVDGCIVKALKPVSVQNDFDPLAPNAFTPDQNGNNDNFIPVAFKDRNDRFKMEIHSLSGQLIYQTFSTAEGWNGQFNNTGQMMPEGRYVWIVVIGNENGQEKRFAGNLKLLKTQ